MVFGNFTGGKTMSENLVIVESLGAGSPFNSHIKRISVLHKLSISLDENLRFIYANTSISNIVMGFTFLQLRRYVLNNSV